MSQGNSSLHCDPNPKRNPNPDLYTSRYSYSYPDPQPNLDSNPYSQSFSSLVRQMSSLVSLIKEMIRGITALSGITILTEATC